MNKIKCTKDSAKKIASHKSDTSNKRFSIKLLLMLFTLTLFAGSTVYSEAPALAGSTESIVANQNTSFSLSKIPGFKRGRAYIKVNNNNPYFTKVMLKKQSFEYYSSLDRLGRCGVTAACIGRDRMPNGKARGSISRVYPTGWHTYRYKGVSGGYLYNRCHLIGYQLTAENANRKNLITGTRYLNIDGMLPFENMVADYVKETGNHVLYRVTPVFKGNELVARGVLMEAESVEDHGDGIKYNVYCYNNQPGVKINYSTGTSSGKGKISSGSSSSGSGNSSSRSSSSSSSDSRSSGGTSSGSSGAAPGKGATYVYSVNSDKFHYSTCRYVSTIKPSNRCYSNSRKELIDSGKVPCSVCRP